jgi:hypothetical protein
VEEWRLGTGGVVDVTCLVVVAEGERGIERMWAKRWGMEGGADSEKKIS